MGKEKLELLREYLYKTINADEINSDDILKASQELDKCIVQYISNMEDQKKNN